MVFVILVSYSDKISIYINCLISIFLKCCGIGPFLHFWDSQKWKLDEHSWVNFYSREQETAEHVIFAFPRLSKREREKNIEINYGTQKRK